MRLRTLGCETRLLLGQQIISFPLWAKAPCIIQAQDARKRYGGAQIPLFPYPDYPSLSLYSWEQGNSMRLKHNSFMSQLGPPQETVSIRRQWTTFSLVNFSISGVKEYCRTCRNHEVHWLVHEKKHHEPQDGVFYITEVVYTELNRSSVQSICNRPNLRRHVNCIH